MKKIIFVLTVLSIFPPNSARCMERPKLVESAIVMEHPEFFEIVKPERVASTSEVGGNIISFRNHINSWTNLGNIFETIEGKIIGIDFDRTYGECFSIEYLSFAGLENVNLGCAPEDFEIDLISARRINWKSLSTGVRAFKAKYGCNPRVLYIFSEQTCL